MELSMAIFKAKIFSTESERKKQKKLFPFPDSFLFSGIFAAQWTLKNVTYTFICNTFQYKPMKLTVALLALAKTNMAQAKILKVHVVPHTHDDVGWLKTVDQYFYGANNTIQHANVQMILTTLIPALEANPERKFSYVEQAFFTRWYNHQDANMQVRVKKLVKSNQLSFINGGWCMHDEAATHYMGMLDQVKIYWPLSFPKNHRTIF
jgi:hypothetical protein